MVIYRLFDVEGRDGETGNWKAHWFESQKTGFSHACITKFIQGLKDITSKITTSFPIEYFVFIL